MSNTLMRKALLPLLILLAASIWTAFELKPGLEAARNEHSVAEAQLARVQRVHRELDAFPADTIPAVSVNDALARTISTIKSGTVARLVAVTALAPAQGATSATGATFGDLKSVAGLTESVAGVGGLKRVSLQMKGSYRNYEHFIALLDDFKQLPAALREFSVDRNSFEMVLDVYGL
jgi:hypothetical protein